MTELNVDRMERRLLEEREQALESLRQAEAEASEGQRESSGALARVPTHLADAASETYATCERCGRTIEQDRLDLVPWTRLCASCARAIEAERGLVPAG